MLAKELYLSRQHQDSEVSLTECMLIKLHLDDCCDRGGGVHTRTCHRCHQQMDAEPGLEQE